MKAVFIGKDSCGFKNGNTYELKSKVIADHIVIFDVNSKANCPYSSIEKFIENWVIVR